ncbi:hypothetical protein K7432_008875 [Basidiobolus ranarum]|uniref:Uncharacterized protein n=1 Tax=Basidiobolus ranarum TaxID=34480 RepID=A0ABR2VXW6_9FUNG
MGFYMSYKVIDTGATGFFQLCNMLKYFESLLEVQNLSTNATALPDNTTSPSATNDSTSNDDDDTGSSDASVSEDTEDDSSAPTNVGNDSETDAASKSPASLKQQGFNNFSTQTSNTSIYGTSSFSLLRDLHHFKDTV